MEESAIQQLPPPFRRTPPALWAHEDEDALDARAQPQQLFEHKAADVACGARKEHSGAGKSRSDRHIGLWCGV